MRVARQEAWNKKSTGEFTTLTGALSSFLHDATTATTAREESSRRSIGPGCPEVNLRIGAKNYFFFAAFFAAFLAGFFSAFLTAFLAIIRSP